MSASFLLANQLTQSEAILPGERPAFETVTTSPLTDGLQRVLIEMKTSPGMASFALNSRFFTLSQVVPSLQFDRDFAIPVKPTASNMEPSFLPVDYYVVRAQVAGDQIELIKAQPNVVNVWSDTEIAPFVCPILPCDCNSGIPKGNLAAVAAYLEADKIWASGMKGEDIVVAVVDGGITAAGRPVKPGETSKRIAQVIDGFPSDWGTTASLWSEHGNMCATDVLGMAPQASLFDIRISGSPGAPSNFISNALAGYQWCINRFRENGTPHIITNSWGIYQQAWDPVYATNPSHPFTRKVEQALAEGMIILFAAGNCGDTCPDGRCGMDTGPGKSIWGANGHPDVMTVGAVNKNGEFVGYSSQGPAALDPKKPDFCSITHFTGYFNSDGGTSAATPIAAGIVALMKQKKSSLSQKDVKNALQSTAKDIGPVGWDAHSGTGIIQGKNAYDSI